MSSADQINQAIADRISADLALKSRHDLAAFIVWKHSKGASGQPPPAPQNNDLLPAVDSTYQIVRKWHKWSSWINGALALGLLKLFSETLLKNEGFLNTFILPPALWLHSVLQISDPEKEQNAVLVLSFMALLVIATVLAQFITGAFVTRLLTRQINRSSNPSESVRTMAELIRLSGRTDYAGMFEFKAKDGALGIVGPDNASINSTWGSFMFSLLIAFGLMMLIVAVLK